MAKWFIMTAILFCLSGCVEHSPAPSIRVVTQVQIDAIRKGENLSLQCDAPGSLSRVLNYLRMLDPYTSVWIDPETFRTDRCQITILYSDGQTKVYRQLHNAYLQVDDGPWKKIDPAIGEHLTQVLKDLKAGLSDTCNFSSCDI